ncbi:MFS transporter [Mesorhizobium sp. L-8-10]|uniref:cyclophilin-like fold protein n=1 Tax=Mesorhizobium sp. L-8-10 TaxID=2744523 RepID=UPI00193767BE|nr:cyclophilin-like fold protein [Mesorhizobium sp. L-8-10]BCH33996.1 MFS transporter [Mesorhizobium sp. L-8-10]
MTCRLITRRAVFQAIVLAGAPFGFAGTKRGYAQGYAPMKIRISFNDQSMTATLEDNPSARDFASLLPLEELTIDNYANNEKISYLPRKLTEEGSGPFDNERPGDVCYYAPWGNLAFFYAGYHWSQGLIRLGRIDGSFDPLLVRGEFPLGIEPVS